MYVISLVQYQIKAFAIPGRYLRQMNMLMFKYVWNSRWEKKERKILVRSVNNGGLNMIDLKTRREADIISQIISIPQNMNQPWARLYVYWFGLLLKPLHPNLASNLWVHRLNIPVKLMEIKAIIQNNIKDYKIWNLNIKLFYAYLIEKVNHKSKMEKQFPQVHWDTVWRTLIFVKNADMQSCLYTYIFNVLPTGEYLMKFKVVDKIP